MNHSRRILLINPNTSAAMTATMLEQACRHATPSLLLDAVTAPFGSPVVASRASYAVASHAVLEAYARYGGGTPDAVLLCCFGDPGLEALREVSGRPVIGLAESSIRAASAVGAPFAIVTMGKAWVAMLEERVVLAKAAAYCRGIYAIDGTGLDVASNPSGVAASLDRIVETALQAGAATIVLGGGALAGMAAKLTTRAKYVDCMQAAMQEANRLTAS